MFTIAIQKWISSGIKLMRSRYATWHAKEVLRQQIAREHKQLLELDQRMLSDIGRTREQAVLEASRADISLSKERRAYEADDSQSVSASVELNVCECSGSQA